MNRPIGSPSLSLDAHAATEAQLDSLDDRLVGLLVYTDVLVAEGYEVTGETKNALLRIVMHLKAVRHELQTLGVAYRVLRRNARRSSAHGSESDEQ